MSENNLVYIQQYAPVDWPWGSFPRLPRTPWNPSPWRVAFFDGDHRYERRIVHALFMYLTVHYVIVACKGRLSRTIRERPTIVCGTLHATLTAVASTVLLVTGRTALWQRVLPFSLSYFLADILWYCLPRRDLTMTLHHLVMVGCHYPVGEDIGAYVGGAGRTDWCVWLSLVGYLSEWTTLILNLRWLLAHTLTKHHVTFTIISLLLLGSFIGRVLLFPYLLLVHILPRYDDYITMQQIWTFFTIVFGHLVVLQLSIQWIAAILHLGFGNFIKFSPKADIRLHSSRDDHHRFNWRESALGSPTSPMATTTTPEESLDPSAAAGTAAGAHDPSTDDGAATSSHQMSPATPYKEHLN